MLYLSPQQLSVLLALLLSFNLGQTSEVVQLFSEAVRFLQQVLYGLKLLPLLTFLFTG